MLLRKFVVALGIAFTLIAISPAGLYAETDCTRYKCTDEEGRYTISSRWYGWTISGVVWHDQNKDGIRQPNEPVAPHERIWLAVHSETHARIHTFLRETQVLDYGHTNIVGHGCLYVYIPRGATEITADIRVVWPLAPDGSRPPLDWPLANGHFFKQTVSRHFAWCDDGYAVTNSDGIPFWDTWQRLGFENVGYPISDRYMRRGFVTQAFQKVIIQWQPGKGVYFVDIFDELHDAGLDEEMRFRFSTPRQLDSSFDTGALTEHWEDIPEDVRWRLIVERRLALLDDNPAIKARYYAAPDPLLRYGLPTSRVRDHGNNFAIRTQRAVLHQWKHDVPWAKAGEVTIANGGDIANELGLLFP